jgi:organic radical activating enzyme
MRTRDLSRHAGTRALRYPLGGVPHATLEVNRTCNIRCRSCYTLDRTHIKSLDAVKRELDLLLEKRKLSAITILGGEPTLHPDLAEIVTAVKSRGLLCQLLTNGVVFLEDGTDRLLDSLIRAGVDRFIVHLDNGQAHVHGNIEKARETLFSKLETKKVNFALSVTVYGEDSGCLARLAKKYSRFRYFDSILAVLARDPLLPKTESAELLGEYRHIRSEFGIEPAAYIPSSVDAEAVHWLLYSYFIDTRTGKAFAVSPVLNRTVRKIYRTAHGRHFFVPKLKPAVATVLFFLAGLADSCLRPKRARSFLGMLAAGVGGIRFHFIVIQTPPEVDEAGRLISICYHCPDATVRNGRLMPVCLADHISPLDGSPAEPANEDLVEAVYSHMGETRRMEAELSA